MERAAAAPVAVGAMFGVTGAAMFVGMMGNGVAVALTGTTGSAVFTAVAGNGDAVGCGGTTVHAARATVKVRSRAEAEN